MLLIILIQVIIRILLLLLLLLFLLHAYLEIRDIALGLNTLAGLSLQLLPLLLQVRLQHTQRACCSVPFFVQITDLDGERGGEARELN